MNYRNASPFFPEEDIDAILQEVRNILSGEGMLTKGPKVKEFERTYATYTGTKYAIATNSCTTALEIVLKSIGLSKDDEVIVPTQTFIATGSSVVAAGGRVIFCDSDDDFSLAFEDLKRKVTPQTKAVIIVHFAGLIHPDIMNIKSYLKDKGIWFIEDCAHANGARIGNRVAGSIGDFGCHSFFSTKVMTTGEGGMITTDNDAHYEVCSSLRSIGLDIQAGIEIFSRIGTNNRMAEFESILGLSQLNRLEEFVAHRINIANIYREELKSLEMEGLIRFQHVPANIRHPYWKFVVFLTTNTINKDDLKRKLLGSVVSIDAPYIPLMHLQPVFKNLYQTTEGQMPNAERLVATHFCLPIHLRITDQDARKISEIIKQAFK